MHSHYIALISIPKDHRTVREGSTNRCALKDGSHNLPPTIEQQWLLGYTHTKCAPTNRPPNVFTSTTTNKSPSS